MAVSYSYVVGVYVVTTYVRYGFKRFHTMNAQYRVFSTDYDSELNRDRFTFYQFVSYATDIMQAMYDAKYDSWIVSFNDNPFGYSPSTSRQVSRFIREYLPFTPNDVRIAYKHCSGITPDIATYHDDNVTYDFHSSVTYHNVWRA